MKLELLNKLGGGTLAQLINHIDRYQACVLKKEKDKDKFVVNAMAPEEELLYSVASRMMRYCRPRRGSPRPARWSCRPVSTIRRTRSVLKRLRRHQGLYS